MGTPRDLDEAIDQMFDIAGVGDAKDSTYAVLKDFLAQRFGAAMLGNPGCEDVLKELFVSITRRD